MRLSTLGVHNASVTSLLNKQAELAQTQQRISSERKFRTAGENPAGMAQSLALDSAQAAHARLADNVTTLRHRLSVEESTLGAVDDNLTRVRELALQANSAALSSDDRKQIAGELEQLYARLVDLANSDDGTGHHLFAGSREGDAPFAISAGGVSYSGDQQPRELLVGTGTRMADGDSGDAVFLRIKTGAQVQAASSNTGTLSVASLDSAAGSAQALSLSFSGGQYEARAADGSLVQSGSYKAGDSLSLPGVRLTLKGTPADGDRLSLTPGGNQDLFAQLRSVITSVQAPVATDAERAQAQTLRSSALSALDAGMNHISSVRSSVGTRLASLDEVETQLGALDEQLQTTLSDVRDIDYAEAISKLQLQTTGLQAAQAVFAKVQGLTLFNYIR